MSEHSRDSTELIDESTCEVSKHEASPAADKNAKGSCLGEIFSAIWGVAFLILILFIAYSRFSYVSIRFLDGSQDLEATVYRWWGFKEEIYTLRLRDVDGTLRWMYGDVEGRLESINYDDRFTSPFIIRTPWKKAPSDGLSENDAAVEESDDSESSP